MALHQRADLRRDRTALARPRPFAPTLDRAATQSQPLGASERMFEALHRFTATNVARVMALEGQLAPTDIRVALHLLRARHPLMRARIVRSEVPRFVVGDAPAVPLQVVLRRDDQHWRRYLEQLLNRPFVHATGPLFEAHYLHDERCPRAELVLVGEHAACDGVSMNSLCAELLDLCRGASPRATQPLRPALDALLPPSSLLSRTASVGAALGNFAKVALQRRLFERRGAARTSAYAFTNLTREETSALVANARWAGTSVTGALMAAVLLSVRERRPRTPRLALSVPVNLRTKLPQHGLTPEDLGNYTSAVYLESGARGDPWELARGLKRELDRMAESEPLLGAVPLVYRAGRLFVREGNAPLAHVMLSNSGLAPFAGDYGAFRALDFYSATSAPMVSADYCFFCNTFAGRLCINLVFAPEIVARGEAEQVLARVRTLLTRDERTQTR